MGKASRKKASVEVSPEMRLGVAWAAELIRHPNVLVTSLAYRKLAPPAAANDDADAKAQIWTRLERIREESRPVGLTPASWAAAFEKALENPKFVALMQAAIEEAHKAFWAEKDPLSAAMFGGNGRLADDHPIAQAIVSAHRRLTADKAGPGWTALALFCFARMAAVMANRSFDSIEWTDLSLIWFDLDVRLFDGEGAPTAKLLDKLNREAFRGDLAKLVGQRMLHGLGEAALNAWETPLFA